MSTQNYFDRYDLSKVKHNYSESHTDVKLFKMKEEIANLKERIHSLQSEMAEVGEMMPLIKKLTDLVATP